MRSLENTLIESGYPKPVKPVTDGTVEGLLAVMAECAVDRSVLLPIATKPSQQEGINNWAASINSESLICFGTVHPDSPDALSELGRIKALGLKGIKLHPDYQGFFADEDRIFPIYSKCAEIGLPVVLHAGLDAVSMDVVHCTPRMAAAALEAVPEMTLILAHMGGNECWDDTERYLVGKKVFLDTSFTAGNIPPVQAKRIIDGHGAERVLFGSDLPWHRPSDEMDFLCSLGLDGEQNRLIFGKNAQKLLAGRG